MDKLKKNLGIEKNYLQPSGETEANYLTEIQNLYDAGYKFIVTPGFKFETAIYKAQEQYSDANLYIIDAAPSDGKWITRLVADNTVAIFFAEATKQDLQQVLQQLLNYKLVI